jgi:hypothetical protein
MSGVVKGIKKGANAVTKIAAPLLGATIGGLAGGPFGAIAGGGIGAKAGKALNKATGLSKGGGGEVQEEPGVPLIDTAMRQREMADRLRRRRGILANIYGGGNSATPSVGTKTLTGQ